MQTPEPQEQHRWLQRLVGEWTYEHECAVEPGKPPEKFVGTDSVRTLGGLWVLCEGKGNMPGFQDLANQDITGIIAYLDNPAAASPPSAASAQASSEGDSGPVRYQTGYGYFTASGGMYARKPPFCCSL